VSLISAGTARRLEYIVTTLGDDAITSSSTVTRYFGEAIMRGLKELSFSSFQQLARAIELRATTLYKWQSEEFWFTTRHLRWVSHCCQMKTLLGESCLGRKGLLLAVLGILRNLE
jgi:hypothetical protein